MRATVVVGTVSLGVLKWSLALPIVEARCATKRAPDRKVSSVKGRARVTHETNSTWRKPWVFHSCNIVFFGMAAMRQPLSVCNSRVTTDPERERISETFIHAGSSQPSGHRSVRAQRGFPCARQIAICSNQFAWLHSFIHSFGETGVTHRCTS